MVAVTFLATDGMVARTGEDLGRRKTEVGDDKLVVDIDPAAAAPFGLERFGGEFGQRCEANQPC